MPEVRIFVAPEKSMVPPLLLFAATPAAFRSPDSVTVPDVTPWTLAARPLVEAIAELMSTATAPTPPVTVTPVPDPVLIVLPAPETATLAVPPVPLTLMPVPVVVSMSRPPLMKLTAVGENTRTALKVPVLRVFCVPEKTTLPPLPPLTSTPRSAWVMLPEMVTVPPERPVIDAPRPTLEIDAALLIVPLPPTARNAVPAAFVEVRLLDACWIETARLPVVSLRSTAFMPVVTFSGPVKSTVSPAPVFLM